MRAPEGLAGDDAETLNEEGAVGEWRAEAILAALVLLPAGTPSRGPVGDVRIGISPRERGEHQGSRDGDPARQNNPAQIHCLDVCHGSPLTVRLHGLRKPAAERCRRRLGPVSNSVAGWVTHDDAFPEHAPDTCAAGSHRAGRWPGSAASRCNGLTRSARVKLGSRPRRRC